MCTYIDKHSENDKNLIHYKCFPDLYLFLFIIYAIFDTIHCYFNDVFDTM